MPRSTCALPAALCLALALAPGSTRAEAVGERPRLLVMDLNAQGVPLSVASGLTSLLALELERGGRFEVVSQQDLRELLTVEEQRMRFGAAEGQEQRLAELAGQVQAPFVLVGSLDALGEHSTLLSLKLIDAAAVRVTRRVQQTLVGEREGLLGALRSAALALTLVEKGVAPDISERLIDELAIGEKPKAMFLSLSPGWETPLGPRVTGESLVAIQPSFFSVRLEVEWPVLPWLRLFGALGFGHTVAGEERLEDNRGATLTVDGNPPASRLDVAAFSVNYRALRLPLDVGLLVTPSSGRFLPYAKLGLGMAWMRATFDTATLSLAYRTEEDMTSCDPPFAPDAAGPNCAVDLPLAPTADSSTFGLDLVAAAGLQWLLSHHLGLQVEARYNLSWFPGAAEDFRIPFEGEIEAGDGSWTYHTGALLATEQVHHGLEFAAGLIVYW